nr:MULTISPECIES: hypothetical protein [unclassified Pseudomonas]
MQKVPALGNLRPADCLDTQTDQAPENGLDEHAVTDQEKIAHGRHRIT